MLHRALRTEVCDVNRRLSRTGLIVLAFGNAGQVDRDAGVLAIKPSGSDYEALHPTDICIVSLETGEVLEGGRPSSDTPTHLALMRAFPAIGGIVHTHSAAASAWAQSGRSIPAFGTTHADHFRGEVPTMRELTEDEINGEYETNTGLVIIEQFAERRLDPVATPGALVARHGPFTWGPTAAKALDNAIALEHIARMAIDTLALAPDRAPVPDALLHRHNDRKHGPGAYYGQPNRGSR